MNPSTRGLSRKTCALQPAVRFLLSGAYAKKNVNRRVVVPLDAVADSVEVAREAGGKITRKAQDFVDNAFAEHLEQSGFLKELWGGRNYETVSRHVTVCGRQPESGCQP